MSDRIKINGVLYEAVSPRRKMSSDRRGKFNQIVYSKYNHCIDIEIISTKDVNKRYTDNPLFEFCYYEDYDSSMYSVGGMITDYDKCDVYFAEDYIKRQTVDKIFRFIIDFDSKLSRPWTIREVNKLANKLKSKFDYVHMDDYLNDMDYSWYEVQEYDESSYDELIYGVLDGDDSPMIFFDTCPDYDRVMDEVQSDVDDLEGLRSWDSRRISASLR